MVTPETSIPTSGSLSQRGRVVSNSSRLIMNVPCFPRTWIVPRSPQGARVEALEVEPNKPCGLPTTGVLLNVATSNNHHECPNQKRKDKTASIRTHVLFPTHKPWCSIARTVVQNISVPWYDYFYPVPT
uniref:Uncharacterized protein n=1 Tax=Craspedostauros australis TaxID=1486917 RepID=A0A7R9ZIF5_9STRA|mmetsp:Transcript_12326/g.33879  ORF Transcript_12326/g.33879 Transcript_12326/m.33879 type:complete len:129 (+) Transcript_12326:564-950(+)